MQRPQAVRLPPPFVTAVIAFLAYSAMAVAYTLPLITHLGTGFLHGVDSDDAFQEAWVVSWVQHALLTNPAALYNAPIFYPAKTALAYIDSMLPVAIVLLPVRLVTSNAAVTYNIAVISSFPLSAICMYAWVNHLVHDSRGAFLAGLIYAYCPYRLRHIEHLNMLSAECIPLTLLCFDMARKRGGKLAWLGFGLSLVLGAVTSLYYTAFALVGLVFYAAVLRLRGQLRILPGTLRDMWPFLLSLPLFAAVLWPYVSITNTSTGPRRLQDMVFFAADVHDFLHTGPQNLLLGWSDGMWRLSPLDTRQYLFPGFVAMGLALLACRRGRPAARNGRQDVADTSPSARTLVIVAALLAILSLGPYLKLFGTFTFGSLGKIPLPYLAFYDLLPPLRGMRDVGRYGQVAMAFLAAASALGLGRLLAGRRPWTARLIFVAAVFLLVVESWSVQQPLVKVQSGAAVPPVYSWLDRQPSGTVLELPICDQHLPWSICTEEFIYMYYQTYHWHPLVNGWAGSYPRDWAARSSALESFPSDQAWTLIKRLDVRYLIVHPDYPDLASTAKWLGVPGNRARHGIHEILEIGGDKVLVLAPSV